MNINCTQLEEMDRVWMTMECCDLDADAQTPAGGSLSRAVRYAECDEFDNRSALLGQQ